MDNLKFDVEGIAEIQRKFFGTLYNTYSFFALYANIDKFTYREEEIAYSETPGDRPLDFVRIKYADSEV
jgi:isoleucyl-tRNA synthetase